MPVSGQASLTSSTGEQILIGFTASYSGGTPGSSSWSIRLKGEITIQITVPGGRPLPDSFIAIVEGFGSAALAKRGNVYRSRILDADTEEYFVIRSGSMGQSYDHSQTYTFVPIGKNSQGGALIDPINGTEQLQTNLYYATSFPGMPQGQWPVG